MKFNIHVNLSLYRAPGYCVADSTRPGSLWTNRVEQSELRYYWSFFAERYKDISSSNLSFNLLNEPPREQGDFSKRVYANVVGMLVQAIHEKDPNRLIIADGVDHGNIPVPEIAHLEIGQSTRGYYPFFLTHCEAHWVMSLFKSFPTPPEWPMRRAPSAMPDENVLDRESHWKYKCVPWKKLEEGHLTQGRRVGIHVGEWGAFHKTPYDVVLKWMEDMLRNYRRANWGWALWNFRGKFGILDSERSISLGKGYKTIVDFKGEEHLLDQDMLKLLQMY